MEGIVIITNTATRKLVVPGANQMYLWSTAFSHAPPRESALIAFLRDMVSFFLRGM